MNKEEKISSAYDADHSHSATYASIVSDVSESALERFQNTENDATNISEHLFNSEHKIVEDPQYIVSGMVETAKGQLVKISTFCFGIVLYSALAVAFLP